MPPNAPIFAQPLGPRDTLDYFLEVSRGDDAADILMPHETIKSFHVALTAEASAAGMVILTDAQHAPILSPDYVIEFWAEIAPAYQTASVFDAGVLLGVEFTFLTSEDRTKTRTVGIKVVGQ